MNLSGHRIPSVYPHRVGQAWWRTNILWVQPSTNNWWELVDRWRRQWHPTPVLLPGKSHGWRSLVGCSPWGHEESDKTERLHFHFSLSCTGEGNGNPLQCSCLENPRDGGAWWAAIYGVAQSQTWLKWRSSSSSSSSSRRIDIPTLLPFGCAISEVCVLDWLPELPSGITLQLSKAVTCFTIIPFLAFSPIPSYFPLTFKCSLKEMKVKVLAIQSCLTLCGPMDCSPPGSSVHRILQARIVEWVAIPFCRGSSQPRD